MASERERCCPCCGGDVTENGNCVHTVESLRASAKPFWSLAEEVRRRMAAEEQERTLQRQLWERIEEGYVFVRGATTSKVAVRFKGHYVALGPDLPSAVRAAQEHSERSE